jgi:hypothetical protein
MVFIFIFLQAVGVHYTTWDPIIKVLAILKVNGQI